METVPTNESDLGGISFRGPHRKELLLCNYKHSGTFYPLLGNGLCDQTMHPHKTVKQGNNPVGTQPETRHPHSHLFVNLLIHLPFHQSIYLPSCLYMCVCIYMRTSIYLHKNTYIYTYTYIYIHINIYISLSICLSGCLFIYLSV